MSTKNILSATNVSKKSDIQIILLERWCELLKDTEYVSIDLHIPMWLWSRGKICFNII